MGLEIAVGMLARTAQEDPEELDFMRKSFDALNAVLVAAGAEPHNEPLDLAEDAMFEAQMWGYSGLHRVRRLAAYQALKGTLPSPELRSEGPSGDPVLKQLYALHGAHFGKLPKPGFLAALFGSRPKKPRYQHLIWHSDCEGFYLPRDFDEVILDRATSPGHGAMVGSSVRLLADCRELAHLIGLPEGVHPEDDPAWEPDQTPPPDAPLWRSYDIEALCLANLIQGCEASIRSNAALQFI